MDLNELFMQRAGLERQNRINMQPEINSSLGNLLGSVVGTGLQAFAKQKQEKQEEQNRLVRVKDQITNFQSMMQKMNEMPDNSASAKGVGLLGDDVNKDRKGITGITRMVPQQEMSVNENGEVNIKLGMRATTPQEQKAQFDIQKSQMEQQKAEGKSQLLDGFIRGEIQEGAILKEMGNLGITPEEFDMAAQARERFRQVSQIQAQQQANAMAQGQEMQTPIMAQQPDQPFRFKPQPASEVKAIRDMAKEDKADIIKSQSAVDSASSSVDAINHLIKNKNYFGPIEGRMPAGINTGKREWAKNYDFLEANKILSVINEMKNQSRTGATGFGNMNEGELRVLTNAAMKLDKQLDEATAEKYLIEMRDAFNKIIDREKNGYPGEVQGSQSATQTTITPEQAIAELKRRGKL